VDAGGDPGPSLSGLGPLDGLVHGSAIEPFTGQTYTALAATTSTIKAKK